MIQQGRIVMINKTRNERIIKMYRDGLTRDAIAAECGISRNVVAGILHRAGVRCERRYWWSSKEEAYLIKARSSGLTARRIGRDLGRTDRSVENHAYELGLTRKHAA